MRLTTRAGFKFTNRPSASKQDDHDIPAHDLTDEVIAACVEVTLVTVAAMDMTAVSFHIMPWPKQSAPNVGADGQQLAGLLAPHVATQDEYDV